MRKSLFLFAAGILASSLAVADNDPPGRAARLSYVAGTVTFQPNGEETEWAPADLNRALTTGDKIWVETGGRAEIQTVNSAIRLNGHTNFSFLTVDDSTTQIQLSLGVMLIRLRGLDENETYEVDTPQVAFTLLRPGTYRIEVNEAGDTSVITVRGGDGETTADGKASPVHTNEQVVIRGNTNASFDKHGAPNPDEFDAWGVERDRRMDSSVSLSRVAPGVVGVTDLDIAGAWRPAPVYGNVWFPNGMVANWAPYRFGHWGFVAPWGWTWIDDAPWGYAPFHYGRWVMVGGAWGWAPGPIAVRALYSPALVSFIGGVEVVGVVDPVSWVALGWGEPWYPSYAVSYGYYNSVNLCGTIFAAGIIAGVWGGAPVNLAYGRDPRAVVVVGRGGFAGGHPIGREFVSHDRLGGHAFDHAGARREGVRGIAGSREARFGGHAPLREGARGFPPRNAMNRGAVTRHEPMAHGNNFHGAGVAARHGPSANGGHAGAFRPAGNLGHPGGAPAHTAAPAHNGPAGGGKPGGAPAHNTPAGGGRPGGGAPSHNATPSSGARGGAPAGHAGTPAGGGSKTGPSTPHTNTPPGGAKGGASTPHTNTPHTNTPAGGRAGGAGTPGRSGTPGGGAPHAPTTGGGAPHNPVGGGGAPKMGGAPTHAATPSVPHKNK